jgi:hypothetical protein
MDIQDPNQSLQPIAINSQSKPEVIKSKNFPLFGAILSIIVLLTSIPIFGFLYLAYTQRLILIPMAGNQEGMFSYGISYTFTANASNIVDTPQGKQLTTDAKLQNLPAILITPKTNIFYVDESGELFTQTEASSIAPDQKLMVNLYYHLIRNEWLTTRINIFKAPPINKPPPFPSVIDTNIQ